jgi:hypothetical protein
VTDGQFLERVRFLKRLGFLALGGLALLLLALALPEGGGLQVTAAVLGGLTVVPVVFYFIFLTLWHWKGRYRGEHSDLWGGLLVIETSGWFKLVYLFRHILPDARGTGRYRRPPVGRAA